MFETSSAQRRLRRSLRFAAAAATLIALAPAAQAQGLFSFFGGPSPDQIERGLSDSGYTLTRPLVRRGDVYLADVMVGRGGAERLLIDTQTGRIIQRFRSQPVRWREPGPGPRNWDPDEAAGFGWGGPPQPPRDVDGWGPPRDQVARTEDASRDTDPVLGTGAPRTTSSDLLVDQPDKSKAKSHEPRHKSVPLAKTPTLSPAAPASPTPVAALPSNPAPNPTPTAVVPPVRPAPTLVPAAAAHFDKSDETPSAAAPAPTPSATVAAKADATVKSDPIAKAPAALESPAAKPSKSKAVNDLPVNPLD